MQLPRPEGELFFKLHHSLMCFVNQRLQVAGEIKTPEEFADQPDETRLKIRNAFLERRELLDAFVAENPFQLPAEELAIVDSWRNLVIGKFFVVRYLKQHAIFLQAEDPPVAYGVLALAIPFDMLLGPYLPRWTEALLLPFRGKIVYDGMLNTYNISFGPGLRRSLNESYKEAKGRLGIVTSLPLENRLATVQESAKKAPKAKPKPRPEDVRDGLAIITGMIDEFCREHLNEEYAALCRKLAEKLARKRPSPLVSGRPNTWACGIVRTIGWVNYLDDRSQKPHLKLTAIDKAFGVGESTGQGKSMQIRRLLKIRAFDPEWTLPSRMDDNPLVWMMSVNGFLMDIRTAPREAQVVAFERGLIPYIPADRE